MKKNSRNDSSSSNQICKKGYLQSTNKLVEKNSVKLGKYLSTRPVTVAYLGLLNCGCWLIDCPKIAGANGRWK